MATKKIIEVDVVNSLSDSDTIFVNSGNSLKQISKSNLVIKGTDGGYYTPSVDADGNLTWTASKTDMPAIDGANIKGPQGVSGVYVGSGDMPEGYNVQIDPDGRPEELPTTLPNPNALTFTGAVTGSYDGSAPLTVEIPSGGDGEWETAIDTTFTESAYLDTGEMPGKTEMLCVFSVPKADAGISLTGSSKAFGKSLTSFAMASATYGKIGFIYAKKICGHAIAYAGSGDTTSTNPDLDTTPRANINVVYYRITSSSTDIPLKLTSALPAGTIIKVFVR